MCCMLHPDAALAVVVVEPVLGGISCINVMLDNAGASQLLLIQGRDLCRKVEVSRVVTVVHQSDALLFVPSPIGACF